jgi:hypothetical protein
MLYELIIPPKNSFLKENGNLDVVAFADYFSGVWGTAFSFVAVIAALLAIYFTLRDSRKVRRLSFVNEILSINSSILSSVEHQGKKGTEAIGCILSEFYTAYGVCKSADTLERNFTIDELVDIAFTYVFFGITSNAMDALEGYGKSDVQTLHDLLNSDRKNRNINHYKGCQKYLGHYFRSLYNIYEFIEAQPISEFEKGTLARIARLRLSNYDQALLAINIISHLGRDWEINRLCQIYQPIKNIPFRFFNFDDQFNIKERFSYIDFG